jgi:hypothetical protein
MNPKFISIMIFILAFGFFGLCSAKGQGQPETQTRDLFTSYAVSGTTKGRPGAKIRLELLREGRRQFVPLATKFHAGDKVKLHFEVNFAAYVAIYNLGTSGQVAKLYPAQGKYTFAAASTNYVVPAASTQWLEFDNTPGLEKLNFTFSSVAPAKRPVKAHPTPGAQPAGGKNATDVVIVEPGGRSLGEEEPSAEESDEALANGRDLNPVQLKDGYYVIAGAQRLKQRVGILIFLDHR